MKERKKERKKDRKKEKERREESIKKERIKTSERHKHINKQ